MESILEFNLPLADNPELSPEQFVLISKGYNKLLAIHLYKALLETPELFNNLPVKTVWEAHRLFHTLNEQLESCGTDCEIHIHEDLSFNLFPHDETISSRNLVVFQILCVVSETGVYWEGWVTGNDRFTGGTFSEMLEAVLSSPLSLEEMQEEYQNEQNAS